MSDSTLLRDLIHIPERAGADDYVLRLTEGVGTDRLTTTIDEYVLTDALATAFDDALGLVADAITNNTSRAAFLAGSFGSGKSHFMAVLHALLGHHPAARAKPELADAIAHHDQVLQNKKILRLAFHFLDAESVEAAILGGYVKQIGELHPEAPLPAVHRSDQLLVDADNMRERLGDDKFFTDLNEAGGSAGAGSAADPWAGVLASATWSAATYDAARRAAPGISERAQLVDALVKTYFTQVIRSAEFVGIDEGLDVISRHAKSLGYDAVVMFLDELVLWLAFRVRDQEFFGREAQKITKLVESGAGVRAIPLVSFVARQLDLRRYFVESGGGAGSDQEALDNAFRHQEGRFRTITLGDDNLPYVAEKRLLAPVSEAARVQIDAAFAGLDRRQEIWDVLLDGVNTGEGQGSNRDEFRRTYPFSPALVSTLRTLASAMQRDRTALKVMQQLLVDQRDVLTVADVIPVGDVFDLVVNGNQAITEEMAGRFRNARTLYAEKLRPLILREHNLSEEQVADLPVGHPFHADDRLAKTLVLSAVAPEVPALRDLTASRLAALNHGSIVSPLPGQESTIVLGKVRRWSAEVPEIHITSDTRNPIVRMKISEVDYESIVEKARGEDTSGRRQQTLKALVWDAFGLDDIEGDVTGISRQSRIWRGSRREVEVVFANIRDKTWLSDDMFRAGPDTWRFIIDYPFDDQGHSVREDDQRLEDLRNAGLDTRTVAWVPHFISDKRLRELGRLVVLDWLLGGTGDRWTNAASDLAPADRAQAKIILENQRDALREAMKRTIQEAYGAAKATVGNLEMEDSHEKVLRSLTHEFSPQNPVGHDLAAAFTHLLDQAFSAVFPGHPTFEPGDVEVRPRDLAVVLDAIEAARRDPDGRVPVEPAKRDVVRRIANGLGVGHMGETHFLFGPDRFTWNTHLHRAMGVAGVNQGDAVTVGTLRGWIRDVVPTPGLRPEVADLVICAWAVQEGRAWYRHGASITPPKPGSITDEIELRPEPLPALDAWNRAIDRAAALVGLHTAPYLSGAALTEFAAKLRADVGGFAAGARPAVAQIEAAYRLLGLPVEPATGRLATAKAAAELIAELQARTDNVALVETLARAELPVPDQTAGRALVHAGSVTGQLSGFRWERLKPLQEAEKVADDRGRAAKAILDRLRSALTADELAQPIGVALATADTEAYNWLVQTPAPSQTTGDDVLVEPRPRKVAGGSCRVTSAGDIGAVTSELQQFVADNPDVEVVVEWRIEG